MNGERKGTELQVISPRQAVDFRGFSFIFWNIPALDITSLGSHTSHIWMSRWTLVTLVKVLLGGTGLISNWRSFVKGSPKLQPPYLRENQREMHCHPHSKALTPLVVHVSMALLLQLILAQLKITYSSRQSVAKPTLLQEPLYGGKKGKQKLGSTITTLC